MLKSAGRNRRRTGLTILGVAASLLLLVSLRTFLGELEGQSGLTPASTLRLVTVDSVSLAMPLPLADLQQIQRVPGVELAMPFQWFGGYYQDPKNFFAQFAVDRDGIRNWRAITRLIPIRCRRSSAIARARRGAEADGPVRTGRWATASRSSAGFFRSIWT